MLDPLSDSSSFAVMALVVGLIICLEIILVITLGIVCIIVGAVLAIVVIGIPSLIIRIVSGFRRHTPRDRARERPPQRHEPW